MKLASSTNTFLPAVFLQYIKDKLQPVVKLFTLVVRRKEEEVE